MVCLNLKKLIFFFLNDFGKENLVEAHRRCLSLVEVGSPTISGTYYVLSV